MQQSSPSPGPHTPPITVWKTFYATVTTSTTLFSDRRNQEAEAVPSSIGTHAHSGTQ